MIDDLTSRGIFVRTVTQKMNSTFDFHDFMPGNWLLLPACPTNERAPAHEARPRHREDVPPQIGTGFHCPSHAAASSKVITRPAMICTPHRIHRFDNQQTRLHLGKYLSVLPTPTTSFNILVLLQGRSLWTRQRPGFLIQAARCSHLPRTPITYVYPAPPPGSVITR